VVLTQHITEKEVSLRKCKLLYNKAGNLFYLSASNNRFLSVISRHTLLYIKGLILCANSFDVPSHIPGERTLPQ